jgi:hypothetical protein
MFVIFFVSALAETNRPPFDLVEAESELVAGFMVEYGSTPVHDVHARRIRGGHHHVRHVHDPVPRRLAAAVPGGAVHLGPGLIWFVLKASFVFFMFAMVKAFVPRYRYDQLMRLGWKVFLPISLAMVAIVAGVLQYHRVGAAMNGGRHGILAAGLARRSCRNDRCGCHLYSRDRVSWSGGCAPRRSAGRSKQRAAFEEQALGARRLILGGGIAILAVGYWLLDRYRHRRQMAGMRG